MVGVNDIEEGSTLSNRLKKWAIWLDLHRGRIKGVAWAVTAMTLLLMIKFGMENVDVVVQQSETLVETIAFDEKTYTPVAIANGRSPIAQDQFDALHMRSFPTDLQSPINVRMQLSNLEAIATTLRNDFFTQSDHLCVHVGNFGVPFDIIAFADGTLAINVEVRELSNRRVNVHFEDVRGDEAWARYADSIVVTYVDQSLHVHDRAVFKNADAFCLQHHLLQTKPLR